MSGPVLLSNSLASVVGCHQFEIAQGKQNPTKIFFMSFMMMRLLLSRIKRQAIISNSMMQSAEWLIKNRSACFRKLTANLGLNVRKFVKPALKMCPVSNKLALAET